MTISVRTHSPVAVHTQIRYQVELGILAGEFAPGARLPSVRSLARRLRLSPGTVAAAYRCLEANGRLVSRPGAGVFVAPLPAIETDTRTVCHTALEALVRDGHSVPALIAAARAWGARPAARRMAAVDTSIEMAEVLAAELQQSLGCPSRARTLDQLPLLTADDEVVCTLPYHVAAVHQLRPAVAVQTLNVEPSPRCREAILALPVDSLVLVVAHAPAVLPFARAVVHGLRGEDITLLTHERGERERWAGAAHAAALVLADTLSFPEARAAGLRNALELRLISAASLAALAARLEPPND